jgi:CheY-like chemotaxis protein
MITTLPYGLSVYLADDDPDDRFLFEEALLEVRNDVKITMLDNGEQLMKCLDGNITNMPNLIFLDLNMPLKNGIECLEEIKKDNNLKNIPVIILSTSNQKETINQVYIKGASHYMCKPDNFGKLKLLLDKVFSLDVTCSQHQPNRDNFIISA